MYKGTNKENKTQQLAIKAIDKSKLSKSEVEEIHDEVKMIQQCDHANIVNYYETYEDYKFIYLCMELCTGGELIENVAKNKNEKITEARAATIIKSLLGSLNHIHSQKIIHRDIKPENIMYDKPNGTVKFIDFGLACQMKGGEKDIAGTPYYLAPEVLTGYYDYECDIWSLGVVLFQLLSGKMPFDGRSQQQLFDNI